MNAFSFSGACCLGPVVAVPGACRIPKFLMKCNILRENNLQLGLVLFAAVPGSLMLNSELLCVFIYPSVFMSLLYFEVLHTMS